LGSTRRTLRYELPSFVALRALCGEKFLRIATGELGYWFAHDSRLTTHNWFFPSAADKYAPPSNNIPERNAQKMSVTEIENGP